jgi:hypothetical protein
MQEAEAAAAEELEPESEEPEPVSQPLSPKHKPKALEPAKESEIVKDSAPVKAVPSCEPTVPEPEPDVRSHVVTVIEAKATPEPAPEPADPMVKSAADDDDAPKSGPKKKGKRRAGGHV